MTTTVSSNWVSAAEVAWVHGAGRVALLDLRHLDRPPLILEGSSAVIWELISEGMDENAIIDEVAKFYDVPCVEVAEHVVAFIQDLDGQGLIEAVMPDE